MRLKRIECKHCNGIGEIIDLSESIPYPCGLCGGDGFIDDVDATLQKESDEDFWADRMYEPFED